MAAEEVEVGLRQLSETGKQRWEHVSIRPSKPTEQSSAAGRCTRRYSTGSQARIASTLESRRRGRDASRSLNPDVAIDLNNLAGLYDTQGRYAEAEPLYHARMSAIGRKRTFRQIPKRECFLHRRTG